MNSTDSKITIISKYIILIFEPSSARTRITCTPYRENRSLPHRNFKSTTIEAAITSSLNIRKWTC